MVQKKTPISEDVTAKKVRVKRTPRQLPKEEEPVDADAILRGDQPMSLVGHLGEFRSRFLHSLVIILVLTIAFYYISDMLFLVVSKPFLKSGHQLNVFTVAEGFVVSLKLSFVLAIMMSAPYIIYQIWKYIVPAIDIKDRHFFRNTVFVALVLFYSGTFLCFFFLTPYALSALLEMVPSKMNVTVNASEYISFIFFFCLMMGVIFELPIVIMILTRLGLVTPEFLVKKRKYAIVLIFIIAALLSPGPDVLSQLMLAVPFLILYEISVVISRIIVIRKKRREQRSA